MNNEPQTLIRSLNPDNTLFIQLQIGPLRMSKSEDFKLNINITAQLVDGTGNNAASPYIFGEESKKISRELERLFPSEKLNKPMKPKVVSWNLKFGNSEIEAALEKLDLALFALKELGYDRASSLTLQVSFARAATIVTEWAAKTGMVLPSQATALAETLSKGPKDPVAEIRRYTATSQALPSRIAELEAALFSPLTDSPAQSGGRQAARA